MWGGCLSCSCIVYNGLSWSIIMNRAELIVAYDSKPIAVLKGAIDWIEQRAVAYRKKGFDILIKVVI